MSFVPRSETASSDSLGCQQRAVGVPATGSRAITWFVSAFMQCSRCAASNAATNCPSPASCGQKRSVNKTGGAGYESWTWIQLRREELQRAKSRAFSTPMQDRAREWSPGSRLRKQNSDQQTQCWKEPRISRKRKDELWRA